MSESDKTKVLKPLLEAIADDAMLKMFGMYSNKDDFGRIEWHHNKQWLLDALVLAAKAAITPGAFVMSATEDRARLLAHGWAIQVALHEEDREEYEDTFTRALLSYRNEVIAECVRVADLAVQEVMHAWSGLAETAPAKDHALYNARSETAKRIARHISAKAIVGEDDA